MATPGVPTIQHVALKRKPLERYRALCGEEAIAEIRALAHELRGLRVLELSSAATGGGVAEMLASLVPLERPRARGRLARGRRRPAFYESRRSCTTGCRGWTSS